MEACACPGGCVVGEAIDEMRPEDSVRMGCGRCGRGGWAHAVCCSGWRASTGGVGATCPTCGGELLSLSPASSEEEAAVRGGSGIQRPHNNNNNNNNNGNNHQRRRTNSKPFAPGGNGAAGSRLRGRAASMGQPIHIATGGPQSPHNSPPHSFPHPRRSGGGGGSGPGAEFFSDSQVGLTGSIFARRESLQSLREALPAWKLNGIHIKLEDDCPQGNDDTRIFLLTTLGDHKMRAIPCVLCRKEIPVYDRYPLLDGTFFLSPVNHHGEGLPVRHDTKDSFLHACCVACLEGAAERLSCLRCGGRGWFPGPSLVLGSLYSFDILSSAPCCAPLCAHCGAALPLPDPALRQPSHYSAFSEVSNCRQCGHREAHYIRRFDSLRLLPASPASTNKSESPLAGLAFPQQPPTPPTLLPSHQLCTA